MRQFFFILGVILILSLTGCPRPAGGPPEIGPETRPIEVPEPRPVPAGKPATEEAELAIERVRSLNGKFELTPAGTLKSISLETTDLDAEVFELFGKQEDLEVLQIANFRELDDSMVAQLASLKKLKNLKLANAGMLSDKGVKTIVESFPNLKSLDLSSNTLLTNESLKEIARLQELEQLIVMYCNFNEFGMIPISKMPKLRSVDIRMNHVGNSGMGFLANLPSLRMLKHRSAAVDDFGLEALTKAKGLATLEIQDFTITDRSGEFIKKFESLTNLIIFRCPGFGSTGLLELKGMPLVRLTLRGLPSVDDTGMEVFRDLTQLKRLYLSELESVTDAGMINLVTLKDLELLDIWKIPITDLSLETVSKLSGLKDLSLRETEITDAAAEILLAMPQLERLTLKDNSKITDAARQKLFDAKKFKHLDFGIPFPVENNAPE